MIIGLLGFWNYSKRKQILSMRNSVLPEDYLIEEIGWLIADKLERNLYSVYTKIAHKDRHKRYFASKWKYRTNGFGTYDVVTNEFTTGWH